MSGGSGENVSSQLDQLKQAIQDDPRLADSIGPQLRELLTSVQSVGRISAGGVTGYCHSHCGSHCNSHPTGGLKLGAQGLPGLAQTRGGSFGASQ